MSGVVEVAARDGFGRPGAVQLRVEDGDVVLVPPHLGGCRLTPRELADLVRVLRILGQVAQSQQRGLADPAPAGTDRVREEWAAVAHRRLCQVADLVGVYGARAQVTGNRELAALVAHLREVIQPSPPGSRKRRLPLRSS